MNYQELRLDILRLAQEAETTYHHKTGTKVSNADKVTIRAEIYEDFVFAQEEPKA